MINWFPGHMKKNLDQLQEKLKLVDLVFLLVDARAPLSTYNEQLGEKIKHKIVLVLLNKADLAERTQLTQGLQYYQKQGFATLPISTVTKENIKQILPLCHQLLAPKVALDLAKGIHNPTFKAIVLGVPNVGKSSLINTLTGSKLPAYNHPGVTKQFQYVRLNEELELLDAPGLMPTRLDQEASLRLGALGCIKDEILPLEQIIQFITKYLLRFQAKALTDKYQVTLTDKVTWDELFVLIAQAKHLKIKDGEPDLERAQLLLLNDFRAGKLGGIYLD